MSQQYINIYKPTQDVKFGHGSVKPITGQIKSVCIGSSNYVQYNVIWYDGSERNEVWLEEWEIQPVDYARAEKLGIGFITQPPL